MQRRVGSDAPPEPFLGKRIGGIVDAQPCLDMRDDACSIRTGARSRVGGQRIALHADDVGLQSLDRLAQRVSQMTHGGGDVRRRWQRRELDVRDDAKLGKRGADGSRVLAAVDDRRAHLARASERVHERRKLDALGPGADDDEDVRHARAATPSPVALYPRFHPVTASRGGPRRDAQTPRLPHRPLRDSHRKSPPLACLVTRVVAGLSAGMRRECAA